MTNPLKHAERIGAWRKAIRTGETTITRIAVAEGVGYHLVRRHVCGLTKAADRDFDGEPPLDGTKFGAAPGRPRKLKRRGDAGLTPEEVLAVRSGIAIDKKLSRQMRHLIITKQIYRWVGSDKPDAD